MDRTLRSLAVILLCSCGAPGEPAPEPDGSGEPAISFHTEVVPIFEAHCVNCHAGPNAQAGLDLTREQAANELLGPDAWTRCFEDGELLERRLVEPGAPDDSVLWIKVADTDLSLECGREMPLGGTALLSSDPTAAETLRLWIADGAVVRR